jgi:hypothetical protein
MRLETVTDSQGRIRAKKKPCGRGKCGEYLVSHDEFKRLRNEGLRPFRLMPEELA